MRTVLTVNDVEKYLQEGLELLAQDFKNKQLECTAEQAYVLLKLFHRLDEEASMLLGPDLLGTIPEGKLPC